MSRTIQREGVSVTLLPVPGTDYWLMDTLVSVEQYERYCAVTGRSMPPAPYNNQGWENKAAAMTNLTATEELEFAAWLGLEIPPISVLHKAELAGRKPGEKLSAQEIEQQSWAGQIKGASMPPLKGKKPNRFGFYDLIGYGWTTGVKDV